MTRVYENRSVEHAIPSQTNQSATGSDEFGSALRQAKMSGKTASAMSPAGTLLGGNPDLLIGESLGKSHQPEGFARSIESMTNGGDVAKTLEAASKAGDIDQVLSEFSPSQLNAVAKKLNGSGLSQNDVNELCNSIVTGGASGSNLAQLTNAFTNNPLDEFRYNNEMAAGPLLPASDMPIPPPDLAATLESSIAGRASAGTRVDYIKALRPEIQTQTGAAAAVATVLTSLKGNPHHLNRAFGMLSNSQLHAVLTADSRKWFVDIVNAAATKGADPNTQAHVFQAATEAFTKLDPAWQNRGLPSPFLSPDTFGKQGLSALTNLLESNPQGIVHTLNLQDNKDPPPGGKGQALTTYVYALIGEGNPRPLSPLLDQLRFGPHMNDDGYVNDPTNNDKNAQALGYFVGSVDKAIAASHGTVEDQIISGAAGLLGVNGPGIAVSTAIQWWAQHAMNEAKENSSSQQSALYETAIADRSARNIYVLPSLAYGAFSEGYSSVNSQIVS